MSGILWICILSVVLVLIQWKSMNAYAAPELCAVGKGGCSHVCLLTLSGYKCTCPNGLSLGQDNKTCEASSPCAENNGECSTKCVRSTSGDNCTCPTGFSLEPDEETCKDVERPSFGVTCPSNIKQYADRAKNYTTVNWAPVVATDNSGEIPSMAEYGVPTENRFYQGRHLVTYNASDTAGNYKVCVFFVTVEVLRCQTLFPPLNGFVEGECDNTYGSTCKMMCNDGYNLLGSDILTCLKKPGHITGYWDRPVPVCKIRSCSSLRAPQYGFIYPHMCTSFPVSGTVCYFECRHGFLGNGGTTAILCGNDGKWSKNESSILQCLDVTPPVFMRCPSDIRANINANSTALVNWTQPFALDNSNRAPQVTITPPGISPPHIFNETALVVYTATDASWNKKECSFRIVLEDNLGPQVVYCPPDQNITATKMRTVVRWKEPEFKDNSKTPLVITCSHQSGTEFYWGTWNVHCTAYDNNPDNKPAVCQFTLTVKRTHERPLHRFLNTSTHERPLHRFLNTSTHERPLHSLLNTSVQHLAYLKPPTSKKPSSLKSSKKRIPTTNSPASGKTVSPTTVILGSLLLITLMVLAIYCLLARTRLRPNARARSYDSEENMGQDNLAYRQPHEEIEMKVMVSSQSDAGFNKPQIHPGGDCKTLDNANDRPDKFHRYLLDSKGATGTQSEIENESNALDSPNCSNEPLRYSPPTSLPKSVTKLAATLFSTGGEFSGQGCSNWERVPDESGQGSQFQAITTVKENTIDSKTRRKIATVYASRPDPRSDLIYLRFYIYSDNQDSKMGVEMTEKERFLDSKPAREQPFRMYNDSTLITVKLTDLEEGWELDKTNDTQIYRYDEASASGSRSACDFAVRPKDGQDVKGFSCMVRFQLEDDQKEYSIYLNPGFAPLKRQSIRRKPAASGQSVTTSSNNYAVAGYSTTTGLEEEEQDCDSHNREGRLLADSRDNAYVQCDHFFASLGLGNDKPVTENLLNGISLYVGVKWKRVLRKLSIEDAIIKNLEEDCKNAPVDEKCYQGLLAWKDGRGPQGATIKTLCNALRAVGCTEALKSLQREISP